MHRKLAQKKLVEKVYAEDETFRPGVDLKLEEEDEARSEGRTF